jgi:hypothetical protein
MVEDDRDLDPVRRVRRQARPLEEPAGELAALDLKHIVLSGSTAGRRRASATPSRGTCASNDQPSRSAIATPQLMTAPSAPAGTRQGPLRQRQVAAETSSCGTAMLPTASGSGRTEASS